MMVEIDLARKNMGREWDILADEIKRMLLVFQDIAHLAGGKNPKVAVKGIRQLTDKEFASQ